MAREGTKRRMFELVKKVRLERLRGLKKPAVQAQEDETPSGPSADEVAALESMLGGE